MPFRKPPRTAFKPGNPGGPGRPRGARSKLNELAIALLHKDFAEHGEDVIRRVRERKPEVYLASVVSLLPKQQECGSACVWECREGHNRDQQTFETFGELRCRDYGRISARAAALRWAPASCGLRPRTRSAGTGAALCETRDAVP